LMPSSRHAWMIRSAISPRFAINIFLNITLHAVTVTTEPRRRGAQKDKNLRAAVTLRLM
jgi:hypothetical protein